MLACKGRSQWPLRPRPGRPQSAENWTDRVCHRLNTPASFDVAGSLTGFGEKRSSQPLQAANCLAIRSAILFLACRCLALLAWARETGVVGSNAGAWSLVMDHNGDMQAEDPDLWVIHDTHFSSDAAGRLILGLKLIYGSASTNANPFLCGQGRLLILLVASDGGTVACSTANSSLFFRQL